MAVGLGGPDLGRVVEVTNTGVRIWSKGGSSVFAGATLEGFVNSAGGSAGDAFDPKVIFDQHSKRFFVVVLDGSFEANTVHILVSKNESPNGVTNRDWTVFSADASATLDGELSWFDYPGIGADGSRLVVTGNMFGVDTGDFRGVKIRVFDKEALLADSNSFADIDIPNNFRTFTVQPAHTYGATDSGNFYLISMVSNTEYKLWEIGGTPDAPVLAGNLDAGSPWNAGADFGFFFQDAPQLGRGGGPSDIFLDTIPWRVMQAVYRDGSVWCTLTGDVDSDAATEVFWAEVHTNGGFPNFPDVAQSGLIDGSTPDAYTYVPSINVNMAGDVMICYTESSPTSFASVRAAARRISDPPNVFQNSVLIKTSDGEYDDFFASAFERWGDYSATVVDPDDDLTFWLAHEYVRTGAVAGDDADWGTIIAKMKPVRPDLTQPRRTFQISHIGGTQNLIGTINLESGAPWVSRLSPSGVFSVPVGGAMDVLVEVDPNRSPGGVTTERVVIDSNAINENPAFVDLTLIMPDPTTVPDVVGATLAEASDAFGLAAVAVGRVNTAFSDTVPSGIVMRQDPIAGTTVPEQTPVDLVVSLGPSPIRVPDVRGFGSGPASTALITAGLGVGDVTTAFSADVPAGLVVAQSPVAGVFVLPETAIDLVVSLGPSTDVPHLVGVQEALAVEAIVGAELTLGSIVRVESLTAPIGEVVHQSPAGGATVAIGTAVDLVVSRGTPVPDVVGLDLVGADTALSDAALGLGDVNIGHDLLTPRGLIAAQSPVAESHVNPGTSVEVLLSLGLDLCDMLAIDAMNAQSTAFQASEELADDFDGDGLPEEFVLALMEAVVCNDILPELADATLTAYDANLLTLMGEPDAHLIEPYMELLALLLSVSQDSQNALLQPGGILDLAGISLLGPFEIVLCDGTGACLPDVGALAPSVEAPAPSPLFPYSSSGDPDGDGLSNQSVFDACPACTPDEFATLALAAVTPEPSAGTGGGGGGGGGCAIATAAYGTPMAEDLDTLRAFRDGYLLDGPFGASFVDAYYRLSPAVAETIAERPALRSATRLTLTPVVLATRLLVTLPANAVTSFGWVISVFAVAAIYRRRSMSS